MTGDNKNKISYQKTLQHSRELNYWLWLLVLWTMLSISLQHG